MGFIISYLYYKPAEAELKLVNYFSLSEQLELPVIIQLDGELPLFILSILGYEPDSILKLKARKNKESKINYGKNLVLV